MEYFLRTGDILHVDVSARRDPDSIKTGDIVAFFEWTGSPVISAHRVWWKTSPGNGNCRLITKGDANLRFDRPVELSQVIGRVAAVSRGGAVTLSLTGADAAATGRFLMIYGICCAGIFSLFSLFSRAMLLCASYVLFFLTPLAGKFRVYWRMFAQFQHLTDINAHKSLRRLMSLVPDLIFVHLSRAPEQSRQPEKNPGEEETVLAGRILGDVVLKGNILICGDVIVDSGSSLAIAAGAKVRFPFRKAISQRACRVVNGTVENFFDKFSPTLLIYGKISTQGTVESPVQFVDAGGGWKGVCLLGNARGFFENTIFKTTADIVRAFDCSGAVFKNCVFEPGGGAGVILGGISSVDIGGSLINGAGAAIKAFEGSSLTMHDTAIETSLSGISLAEGASAVLSGVEVSGSPVFGLKIEGPAYASVSDSLFAISKTAVLASGRGRIDLRRTRITGTDGFAIVVRRKFRAYIDTCVFPGSTKGGVRAAEGARVSLIGTVLESAEHGIDCRHSDIVVSRCHFRGNSKYSINASEGRVELDKINIENSGKGVSLGERSRLRAFNSGFKNCRCGVITQKSRCELTGCSVSCEEEGIISINSRVTVSDCDFDSGSGIALEEHSRLRVLKSRFRNCRYGVIARRSSCELSGCSVNSVEECVSSTGSRIKAVQNEFRAEKTGIGLYSASRMVSSRSVITACDTGMVVNGASRCRFSRDRIVRNRVGVWLQENSRSRFDYSMFSDNSRIGLYLSGRSTCHAGSMAMARNIIGVFADEESEISVKAGKFRANQTAFKVDNNSRLRLSDSVIFKSEWDGLWCGGGAEIRLSKNRFICNRYAIKEDEPCSIIVRKCVFRNNTLSDRLVRPHE